MTVFTGATIALVKAVVSPPFEKKAPVVLSMNENKVIFSDKK